MFDRIVERLLEAAQAEGTFDNLPGRGRPLALDGDENDPDWAAQRLLKHNGARPPWLEEDLAIREALEDARAQLLRAATFARSRTGAPAAWQGSVARFRERASDLNRRIRDYNLSVPLDRLQRLRIDIEAEIDHAWRVAGI
ncbi:MAG TPA: DUF1992 domain-containing protein [Anaerolineales bacterium]|nr:DUF1992 domain-containing protein [Anaerolineales bacterium]